MEVWQWIRGVRQTIAVIIAFRKANKISLEHRPAIVCQVGEKHPTKLKERERKKETN